MFVYLKLRMSLTEPLTSHPPYNLLLILSIQQTIKFQQLCLLNYLPNLLLSNLILPTSHHLCLTGQMQRFLTGLPPMNLLSPAIHTLQCNQNGSSKMQTLLHYSTPITQTS